MEVAHNIYTKINAGWFLIDDILKSIKCLKLFVCGYWWLIYIFDKPFRRMSESKEYLYIF